jgi:hypothetical protein
MCLLFIIKVDDFHYITNKTKVNAGYQSKWDDVSKTAKYEPLSSHYPLNIEKQAQTVRFNFVRTLEKSQRFTAAK